ncbi:hypothetical protein AWM75_06375 [Aerococcus urinaehominis]|uniref:Uncharacterized protein n=1 Tax=Aerococcus urinaehominis TaxID=128944 RepID=A0A0X8FLQ6_9LACT|nr:DsbA family protein [Aerococcus urinaehominis]AMB99631.1 hypothetical protein AWM75_06375 [Aerococcus urinaehominis]SDL88079.1 Predicted dithiol-disulfide isomerase, DsbA family [Aerococcus urinaehominis]
MTDLDHQDHKAVDENIFELFLFVNPLGSACYNCEQEILKFISETDKRVFFRFITFHNFQLVNQYLAMSKQETLSLADRNILFKTMQQVALGYRAALFQGKKLGREYLLRMQKHFSILGEEYSLERSIALMADTKLDIDMFLEDIESDFVKEDYLNDQKLAMQMQIRTNPSLVLFDNNNFQYGLRIESDITADHLHKLTSGQACIKYNQEPTCDAVQSNKSTGQLIKLSDYSGKPL